MKTVLMPHDYLVQVSETIKIIGHPQRLRILEFLDLRGESTVGAIIEGTGGQQAAISQHLNKMRLAGIIRSRRAGRQIYYGDIAESAVTILACMRRKYEKTKKA
jgi:ArsR family transcriptional regulator